MLDALTIFLVICIYIGLLFLVANWADRSRPTGRNLANNAVVYSLSLAVYCTSWTFYGSVGNAATSSFLFLTIYIGPTLSIILWDWVLVKLIKIKQSYRINSIADFIAARYDRSQLLAAMVTLMIFVGMAPYIALQFKAVIAAFEVLAIPVVGTGFSISDYTGQVIVVLMITFTIMFGVRKLDPTERHQGMVFAVAVESIVKLVAFLAIGIFVTYFVFNGIGDVFSQWSDYAGRSTDPNPNTPENISFATWLTYLLLGMSAIFFLPRQFHISVVENASVEHVKTAKWLFPLYMFLINLFVLPIALVGLMKGLPEKHADMFVLYLPLQFGDDWLTLLVFLGGFSAAASMIMISSMTMSTMLTNHILLPLLDFLPGLGFLRMQILKLRWLAVAAVILFGYWFERALAGSQTLVNMGIISFAAAFQFAPCIIGGIFWRRGNLVGALLGLGAGFATWVYTLLLPTFIRSGWIASQVLKSGPWGVELLKPESLFGLTGLPFVPHGVFWSILLNLGCYILGSILFSSSKTGEETANAFVGLETPMFSLESARDGKIDLEEKRQRLKSSVKRYLGLVRADRLLDKAIEMSGLKEKQMVTVVELMDFCSSTEKLLAGSIGTAAAYKTLKSADMFTKQESGELTAAYSKILAELEISPEELKKSIDYHKEKETLMAAHADALEGKVTELQQQITERERVEEELRTSEERYRVLYTFSKDAIMIIDPGKAYINANPAAIELFGCRNESDLTRKTPIDFSPLSQEDGQLSSLKEKEMVRLAMENGSHYFKWKYQRPDGSEFFATVLLTRMELPGKTVLHATVRDVTDRIKADRELIQAQKMETVGTLAGGLAHDFNNVLGGIMATLSLISHKLKLRGGVDSQKLLEYIEVMTQSGVRASDMISQLLTLSRKQELNFAPVDLNLTIKHVVKIARNSCDKSVQLNPGYQTEPAMVMADPSQIERVLLNLCVNAEHSMTIMKGKDQPWGGILSLSTERITPDDHLKSRYPEAGESDYWILSVSDTGVGMSARTIGMIFDPFFTTKDKGKGTGLGLAMVYNSVRLHNGFLDVRSSEGAGTTVNVYLPVMQDQDKHLHVGAADVSVPKGEGLILVVDDEELMRLASRDILEECGYTVMLAENGQEALDIFRTHHGKIKVILLDMAMPLMSGRETYYKMKEIDPDLRVILVSGLKTDVRVKELLREGIDVFLQKPFTIETLASAVHQLIAGE